MPEMEIRRATDPNAQQVVEALTNNGAFRVEVHRSELGHAIIVAREEIGPRRAARRHSEDPDLRWHISVSLADRIPTWEELVEIGHRLRPGVVFGIGLPPRSWWLNVHEFTLHLWELKDANLIEEWRRSAQGHTPT